MALRPFNDLFISIILHSHLNISLILWQTTQYNITRTQSMQMKDKIIHIIRSRYSGVPDKFYTPVVFTSLLIEHFIFTREQFAGQG